MNKKVVYSFLLLIFTIVVIATAPTIPNILSPADNANLFVNDTLRCSGSTGEDNISIEFYQNISSGIVEVYTTDSGWTTSAGTGYSVTRIDTTECRECYIENVSIASVDTSNRLVIYDSTGSKLIYEAPIINGVATIQNNLSSLTQYYFATHDVNNGSTNKAFKTITTPVTHNVTIVVSGENNDVLPFGGGLIDDRIQSVYQIIFNTNETNGASFIGNATEGNTSINWTTMSTGNTNSWTCRACNNNTECSNFTDVRSIHRMSYTQCTSGNVALNLTFLNESDPVTAISGTLQNSNLVFDSDDTGDFTSTFTNSTEQAAQMFCLNPATRTLSVAGGIGFSASNFPQRPFIIDNNFRGDTTLHLQLYLLPSVDGIFTTFQVLNSANQPVQNVKVIGKRTILGTSTTIVGDYTDDAGTVTFFLNPNFAHTFTFSKSGFNDFITTINPTQSTFTINMVETGLVNITNPNFGITFAITPTLAVLNNATGYNFSFTIQSDNQTLDSFGFDLVNTTGTSFASQTGVAGSGGMVSSAVNTSNQTRFNMNYYWVIDGVTINGTKTWAIRNTEAGTFSLSNFFDDLKNFDGGGLDNFGRNLIAFVIIFGVVALVSREVGTRILTNEAGIGLIVFLIWFFEYVGFISTIPTGEVQIPFMTSILTGMIGLGWIMFNRTR